MVIEVIKCACGLDMVMRGKSADIGVCMNCDGVQAGEKEGPRVLTAQDHAFHKALSARVKGWFPTQDPRPIRGYV